MSFQGVGQGVFWAKGASGSVELRPDNDQSFTQFAAAATDRPARWPEALTAVAGRFDGASGEKLPK